MNNDLKMVVATIWNVRDFAEGYKKFLTLYGTYEIVDSTPIISKTDELLGYKIHFYIPL